LRGVIGKIGRLLLDTGVQPFLHQRDDGGVPMGTTARREALVHRVSDQRMAEPVPALTRGRHGLDGQAFQRFAKGGQRIDVVAGLNDRRGDVDALRPGVRASSYAVPGARRPSDRKVRSTVAPALNTG
jgi:hypothetical protein